MHGKRVALVLISAFIIFHLVGCGSPPQDQINTAQAALEAAKNAEADRYVPDKYGAAKNALDGAMAESGSSIADLPDSAVLHPGYRLTGARAGLALLALGLNHWRRRRKL